MSFSLNYNDGDYICGIFLTEKIFNLIIERTNEVVVKTLADGSTIQNLYDLNAFLSQAILDWEYMKKTPNEFAPRTYLTKQLSKSQTDVPQTYAALSQVFSCDTEE